MQISLKWKLVVFLSLVLITMTTAWTWQTVSKQLDSFQSKLSQTQAHQNTLLSELITDSYLKLSQFSQLIAERKVVLESLDAPQPGNALKNTLEKDWISYNINLGLDYIAVFDDKNRLLGDIYSPELHAKDPFYNTITEQLKKRQSVDTPSSFIYCTDTCLLVALEPFINTNGKNGTIAVAQNMADIVRVYFNFARSGLGILIGGDTARQMIGSDRYLKNWGLYAWAVSNFNKIFPVLKSNAEENIINRSEPSTLHKQKGGVYLINLLQLDNIHTFGDKPYFVAVNNETADYNLMHNNITRGVITGIVGLFGAELALLLLLISPLNKLRNITNALHLLPQQEFLKAATKVESRRPLFPDELSTLESSTAYVAKELEKLHLEIHSKNISLEKQIHALTRSRSFLTRLFDNAQIFILTQDMDFNILSTNRKFDALYNHNPRNFKSLFSDDTDGDRFVEMVQKLKSGETDLFHQEITQIDKDGVDFIITWTHALAENEEGEEIILSIGMDQTKQKKAEKNLRWMANHDSLTGLGNRRYFNSTFSQLLESGIEGALVFIDVNRFKQINDIYGHSVGDQVLLDITDKLRNLTRHSDVICRFAGDEFIAILTNINGESLPPVLEKISESLNSSIKTKAHRTINYSVSIGASLFPEQECDAQSLIINADMAMYNAKKKGLSNWHIYDANDERVVQLKNDHNLILAIKNALKNELFKLVYQPILDIASNTISHYEVLLRMFDERGELISPALFIPVAERSGEIRKIDEWVLEHALSEMCLHSSRGADYRFAINISAPTMQADDFPQMISDAVRKYQVDASRIIIELTETAYIENFQQVLKNLKQITKLGVKVALDDFGVGFSSFTYLKMLPLSYVKLDGSYIQHLVKNPDDQVFVKSLAAIIDAYGMKTIAEFVEDRETLELLSTLGVTHGQGYYIGHPGDLSDTPSTEKCESGSCPCQV